MKNKKKQNIPYYFNYKNVLLIQNFMASSSKIIPKRLNRLSSKKQRYLSKAIKNARLVSFLPFVRLINY
uniref:Small ribosomal subunit protein bS18c n=1 Tax=Boodleopsis sp. FL1161 TaxID=2364084 RepID=A0A386AZ98_9CHLO|nr:ribosomal protein S18 [Boodleopsis sp. FL1161]